MEIGVFCVVAYDTWLKPLPVKEILPEGRHLVSVQRRTARGRRLGYLSKGVLLLFVNWWNPKILFFTNFFLKNYIDFSCVQTN